MKKNWPCSLICSLCYCIPETTDHRLMKCNYTEALWNTISPCYNLPHYDTFNTLGVQLIGSYTWPLQGRADKRKKPCILLYFWWHIWKEKGRRIFYNNLNYSTPGRHCLVLSDDDAPKQPGAPGYILDTYKFSDRASIFSSFPVNT
jgi:hypothetical protein